MGIMRVLEVVVLVEEEVVLVVGDVGCSTFMFTTVVVSEVAAGAPLAATSVWLTLFCVAPSGELFSSDCRLMPGAWGTLFMLLLMVSKGFSSLTPEAAALGTSLGRSASAAGT